MRDRFKLVASETLLVCGLAADVTTGILAALGRIAESSTVAAALIATLAWMAGAWDIVERLQRSLMR